MNHAQFWGGGGAAPYEIEQSLRFNSADNAYLQESSIGVTTTCTISWWHKKAAGSTSNTHWYIGSYPSGWTFESTDTASNGWTCLNGGGSLPGPSGSKYRDYSAWHHWVFTQNGTTSTMWLNGVKVKEDTSNSGSSKTGWRIGEDSSGANNLNGYMAEFIFLDGTAVSDPDGVLGEFDDNGVWRPIEYTGSYGTNGFYLKFDPSATNGIGHDHSGNGNNFTANNFTTSGTGTDVMSDTPTNNFCTINPLAFFYVYYGPNAPQNGNLDFVPRQSYSGNHTHGVGTFPMQSGKWYFEVENDGGHSQAAVGIFRVSDNTSYPWNSNASTYHYVYSASNGDKTNTSSSAYGASWSSAGDIVGVAYDGDNGTLTFYKNGTSQGTAFTGLSGTFVPRLQMEDNSGAKLICNFGQRDFAYTPPTGFNALSTSNIPAPDIADGSKYFSTTLYTGVSGSQSVDTGMATDLAWIKSRSGNQSHSLTDRVRGNDLVLQSNENSVEASGVIDLTSTGVTIGNNNALRNSVGASYVLWSWLAGGSGSSNTDGDITSTVSVNATAGFSIVAYTAENAVRTIGHGLGVAPVMYITKRRDGSNQNWAMYWKVLGATRNIKLDLISKNETDSTYWNDTAPTSTVFTVGTNTRTGAGTDNYIAYCFAEVEGFSKFSEYSANGNTDGPFVYCGFRPAMVIIKNYAGGSETNWVIKDAARDTYNPSTKRLNPNQNYLESDDSNVDIDFLSNGFKVRSSNTSVNENGSDYLFMAFAENPFGGDGVSPATAR